MHWWAPNPQQMTSTSLTYNPLPYNCFNTMQSGPCTHCIQLLLCHYSHIMAQVPPYHPSFGTNSYALTPCYKNCQSTNQMASPSHPELQASFIWHWQLESPFHTIHTSMSIAVTTIPSQHDYTTVLFSIPWYFSILNQFPLQIHPQQLNPNPYLSVYCFLQTNQMQSVIGPILTTISMTAYLPALATIFKVWNRIWHSHSYYPYQSTPQLTTSKKNLLCPP